MSNMFFSVEKLNRRVEELARRRYFGMQPIESFTAMQGDLDKDAVYHELPAKIEGMTFARNEFFPGRCRIPGLQEPEDRFHSRSKARLPRDRSV